MAGTARICNRPAYATFCYTDLKDVFVNAYWLQMAFTADLMSYFSLLLAAQAPLD